METYFRGGIMQDQNGNPDDPKKSDDPILDPELQRLVDIAKEDDDVPIDFEREILKRMREVTGNDKGNSEQGEGGTQSEP